MVGNKLRAVITPQTVALHVNESKISYETDTHFLLCLGRMGQMFSRFGSNNFLFEEGWQGRFCQEMLWRCH